MSVEVCALLFGMAMVATVAIVSVVLMLSEIRDHLKTIADSLDLPDEWKKNAGPAIDASRRNVQAQPK